MVFTFQDGIVVYDTIPVEGIRLDIQQLTLVENESQKLEVTIDPDNATDATIVWESSDKAIATVENGVVTAVAMGTATITAKTEDGNISDTCTVTVWGSCGENVRWFLESKTLTIDGEGAMYDYTESPWFADRKNITTVIISLMKGTLDIKRGSV